LESLSQIARGDSIRRIHRLQAVTIVWMSVEALVSLSTAWMARSPALLAFGGDSAVGLFSAVVVLWAFRADAAQQGAQKRAAHATGSLLFVLAVYVTTVSVLTPDGSQRTQTYLFRCSHLDCRCCIHALACEGEKKVVSGYRQCRAQSRCG
jgi:cytochrome c oxidase assembly factor CtaG